MEHIKELDIYRKCCHIEMRYYGSIQSTPRIFMEDLARRHSAEAFNRHADKARAIFDREAERIRQAYAALLYRGEEEEEEE